MQRRFLPIIAGVFLSVSLINLSCNKLDTTDIGSDLIPPIDNVSTFEMTLPITTTQGIFNDSTVLASTDDHVVGSIATDPIFGKTNADVFLELKPTFFPFYFGNAKDTINPALVAGTGFDSVVLCLSFKGYYGDSTIPQTLKVYQIANSVTDFKDSGYKIHNYYPALGAQIGAGTFDPRRLGDTIKLRTGIDSISRQIRIKLNSTFANALFAQDSTGSNAFVSDSLFRNKYKGFAVVADSTAGEGLFYVNLADATTRLEVHFRRRNGGTKVDTAFSSFTLSTGANTDIAYSARANYVNRNRAGAEYNPPAVPGSSDAIYLQTTPGTYANLHIPGLDTLSNNIIHRAEIIIEQLTDPKSNVLAPPAYLYLDAIDTPNVQWRPLPYDLSPSEVYSFFPSSAGINFAYFGGYLRHKKNLVGADIGYYNFNVSRYVQNMVTRGRTSNRNYDLRVYAPFEISYPSVFLTSLAFSNSLAYGRVKVGSGTNASYRMRLHIIYSKI